MDRETEAGNAAALELLKKAACEGIHPQIFIARVLGSYVGHIARTNRDSAMSTCRSVAGLAIDMFEDMERQAG